MDEYISKQTFKEKYLCCGWLPEMSEEEFDAFPAADVVEVRHGRWIDNTFCSCCGGFDEDNEGNIIQSFHNYCPACGARMDKEDEHEAD